MARMLVALGEWLAGAAAERAKGLPIADAGPQCVGQTAGL